LTIQFSHCLNKRIRSLARTKRILDFYNTIKSKGSFIALQINSKNLVSDLYIYSQARWLIILSQGHLLSASLRNPSPVLMIRLRMEKSLHSRITTSLNLHLLLINFSKTISTIHIIILFQLKKYYFLKPTMYLKDFPWTTKVNSLHRSVILNS